MPTVKNHDIHVKVSADQLQLVKNNANAEGFVKISDFVRDRILGNGLALEKKVDVMFRKVMGYELPKGRYQVRDRDKYSDDIANKLCDDMIHGSFYGKGETYQC